MPEFLSPLDLFAPVYTEPVVLTDAAVIAVDATQGNLFYLTLGGSHQLGTPTGPKDGQKILLAVTQDNTGSRVLSYTSAWEFCLTLPQPVLSVSPGKTDYLGFIYSGAASVWRLLAFLPGF